MNGQEEHSAPPTAVPEIKSSDPPVEAAAAPEAKSNGAAPIASSNDNAPAADAMPSNEGGAGKGAAVYKAVTPPAEATTPADAPAPAASDKSTGELPAIPDSLQSTFKFQDNQPVNPSDSGRDTLFVISPTTPQVLPTPAAKSAGQTCPKCGHLNRAGILVCEKCGTLLISDEHAGSTKRFEQEKKAAEAAGTSPTVTETTELFNSAITSAGSSQFTENMVLRLEIEGAPTPIMVHPKFETSLGRRDPATGTMPDVDLSAYAGYRLGVSRKHAIIRLKNRQLELYDLGSSNGTSVNGTKLNPHQSQVLRDGDEVLLGKMMMRVLFQVRNRH